MNGRLTMLRIGSVMLPPQRTAYRRYACRATSMLGRCLPFRCQSAIRIQIDFTAPCLQARRPWNSCWRPWLGCSGCKSSSGIWSGCVPIGTSGNRSAGVLPVIGRRRGDGGNGRLHWSRTNLMPITEVDSFISLLLVSSAWFGQVPKWSAPDHAAYPEVFATISVMVTRKLRVAEAPPSKARLQHTDEGSCGNARGPSWPKVYAGGNSAALL